jgi:hypothetical protein
MWLEQLLVAWCVFSVPFALALGPYIAAQDGR